MNILAHQYLSFSQEPIMIGNFIADTVKGKSYHSYDKPIQNGILLHRFIDSYTDSNALILQGRKLLYPHFGKYAGVVQDVFFDYFLAKNWPEHNEDSLSSFTQNVYQVLEDAKALYNEKAARMFHFMREQNWLEAYATPNGIQKALTGLSRRTQYESRMDNALPALELHGIHLERDFNNFFPELIDVTKKKLSELNN